MRSPGVKRQYSGTLGKIGNCQIGVSLHAAGRKGTVPLGWALYLPEEWCADAPRRRRAKIPEEIVFQTKPQLAADLAKAAAAWEVPRAPILADAAYGDNTAFRTKGLMKNEENWVDSGADAPDARSIAPAREALEPLRLDALRAEGPRGPAVFCRAQGRTTRKPPLRLVWSDG